jgi:glycerophosphoryl diester phosphodiesterase
LVIHLLGDAISPGLVGFVSDISSLRVGMFLFTISILLAGLIWAWKFVRHWECLPWPEGALKLPRSQCHRGLHPPGVQENTLAAFRAAAGAGAEMVELDVRLSRDGVPVVVHDDDIQRIAGREGRVADLSAAELERLARVPSLRAVLTDGECRDLRVNIELKAERAATDGLEAAVAQAVRDTGTEGRVLFSSFNPLALRRISRYLPQVPRALLATREVNHRNKFYLREMLLAFLARPHMLNLDFRDFTPERAAAFARRRVPVAVWTVDDPELARKCLAMGAESIISPVPRIV